MTNYEAKYTAEHAIRLQYEKAIEENLPTDRLTVMCEASEALSKLIISNEHRAYTHKDSHIDWQNIVDTQTEARNWLQGEIGNELNYGVKYANCTLKELYRQMVTGEREDWSNLPSMTPLTWGRWTSKNFVWSADKDYAIRGDDVGDLRIVPIEEVAHLMDWEQGVPAGLAPHIRK